jgi:hypothetical protein
VSRPPQRIEVVMDAHGHGIVKVDGVELQGVYALIFTAGVAQANDLTLQLRAPHLSVTGPARVHKLVASADDVVDQYISIHVDDYCEVCEATPKRIIVHANGAEIHRCGTSE